MYTKLAFKMPKHIQKIISGKIRHRSYYISIIVGVQGSAEIMKKIYPFFFSINLRTKVRLLL